jgi:hypothetical protein
MEKWNSYTGEMILEPIIDENGNVPDEPALEDQFKHAIYSSSNGELSLVKLYHTDGFGWYFYNNKIVFVLHECKANIKVKTMRGFITCLKKAFLQNIGYYFKIKHGKIKRGFPKKLVELSKGYDSIHQFIIDNFGLFLMTNEVFVSHIVIDDKVQELLDTLEPLILETDKSPSNYWDDPKLREVMESFDVLDYPFERMDKNVDIADTGKILNNILK